MSTKQHLYDPWTQPPSAESIGSTTSTPSTRSRPIDLCGKCRNYGIYLTFGGTINECPTLQLELNDHRPLNDAARAVLAAGRHLTARGLRVTDSRTFSVACALTRATTDDRLTGHDIVKRFFGGDGSLSLRHFHTAIEELRARWLLPVCSSRTQPWGYWIATDAEDFAAWVEQVRAAPLRQLATIHAVARANFPAMAEQMVLDFALDERGHIASRGA